MFNNKDFVNIWEIYKLTPEKDLIVNNLGMWTKEKGLNLTALEKWQRRGDLSVRFDFNPHTHTHRPAYDRIYWHIEFNICSGHTICYKCQ